MSLSPLFRPSLPPLDGSIGFDADGIKLRLAADCGSS
jgi:hypothetical protein